MKITKPKKNQILIEDNRLEYFNLEVKSKTGLNETEYNEVYEGLIFGYRQPGMDASKQVIMGDRVSTLTLLSSILDNLIRHKIYTKEDLYEMVKTVSEMTERGN